MPSGIADFGGKGLNTGKKMNSNAESATQAADMIARLGWLSYSQGFVCGLTAAQWTALRYFARANCFSRTVSAFADYHATTRGTASQTVKSLVTQGLLTRTRSKSDARFLTATRMSALGAKRKSISGDWTSESNHKQTFGHCIAA